jgi:hypothetical protein
MTRSPPLAGLFSACGRTFAAIPANYNSADDFNVFDCRANTELRRTTAARELAPWESRFWTFSFSATGPKKLRHFVR